MENDANAGTTVLLFTALLFASGCIIQQRTLREIRRGIKEPAPSPRIFLPDRFKHTTTELADGTVVIIEDEYHADRRAAQRQLEGAQVRRKNSVPPAYENAPPAYGSPEYMALREAETRPGFIGPVRKPPGDEALTARERNERAQLEQNLRHPDPNAVDQRPISRAERRRLIKEELRRLSHVEGPSYQRRLW